MAGLQLLGKMANKPVNAKTVAAVHYNTERMLWEHKVYAAHNVLQRLAATLE